MPHVGETCGEKGAAGCYGQRLVGSGKKKKEEKKEGRKKTEEDNDTASERGDKREGNNEDTIQNPS